jgi:carbonic anhydrase
LFVHQDQQGSWCHVDISKADTVENEKLRRLWHSMAAMFRGFGIEK